MLQELLVILCILWYYDECNWAKPTRLSEAATMRLYAAVSSANSDSAEGIQIQQAIVASPGLASSMRRAEYEMYFMAEDRL